MVSKSIASASSPKEGERDVSGLEEKGGGGGGEEGERGGNKEEGRREVEGRGMECARKG